MINNVDRYDHYMITKGIRKLKEAKVPEWGKEKYTIIANGIHSMNGEWIIQCDERGSHASLQKFKEK